MGEIADLMINGDICEGCGMELGEGDGYPRKCSGCRRAERAEQTPAAKVPQNKVACPTCGKRVKAAGLEDHKRDAHGAPQRARKA